VSDLQAELPIDRRRIYASGFSNGANFTARLAMERSSRLAAVAYSGGGLTVVQSPARPIPMYGTVGTLDDRVLEKTGLTELPLDPLGAACGAAAQLGHRQAPRHARAWRR
jgi:polyhydroxybutyrate depolymerase